MLSEMFCLRMHVSPTHETTGLDNTGWCFWGLFATGCANTVPNGLYLMTTELDTGLSGTMMQVDLRGAAPLPPWAA